MMDKICNRNITKDVNCSRQQQKQQENKHRFLVATVFVFLIVLSGVCCNAGPVNVRVESENNQSFHLGPEPRTRFELVEQYSPLATAKKVHHDVSHSRAFASSLNKAWQPVRSGSFGHKQPVQVVVDLGKAGREQPESSTSITPGGGTEKQNADLPGGLSLSERFSPLIVGGDASGAAAAVEQHLGRETLTKSQWLDWSKWSKCENGERSRTRKCIMVNNIPCETGSTVERQKCYSTNNNSGLKFARDPIIIEREIRGELVTTQQGKGT